MASLGYHISRVPAGRFQPPGSEKRPVGDMTLFLEDIRARGLDAQGIIDVGANRGDWTEIATSVFPGATILMIEPLIETRGALEKMAELNNRLKVVPFAVGEKEGVFIQTVWEDLVGSSFLPEEGSPDAGSKVRRETPVTTLDSLTDKNGFIPEIVKLDIQGWELKALMGANHLFGKTEVFILEVSLYEFIPGTPILREVIEFMGVRGYEFYDLCGYSRRPLDGALGQVDIAFARQDGLLRNNPGWA